MVNISQITTSIKSFADALTGKWERKYNSAKSTGTSDTTWVIVGQVVFLDGDYTQFPYSVIHWFKCTTEDGNSSGYWGILE